MHLRTIARPACLAAMALWMVSILAPSARCQSATMGGLSGKVVSADSRAIAEASVHLLHAATQQVQTATTGADGAYAFTLLAPGMYEVRFAARGFKTARMPRVVVNVAEAPTLEAILEPGETAEPVACQCQISLAT